MIVNGPFVKAGIAILAFIILLTTRLSPSQLPPSQTLTEEDTREFNAELARLAKLLPKANDKGAVQFQIAKTYAAGGQYPEALEWLRRVISANLGFDPSRDPDFSKIRNTVEFRALVQRARIQTPPVSNSRSIGTIRQPDLFPENFAFDPDTNSFYLGSTAKDEILRCPVGAGCVRFIKPQREAQGYVLGLKIDKRSGSIWATSNRANEASLRQYDIHTGRLIRMAQLEGKHVFNDVALSSSGAVYVTDTTEGAIYEVGTQSNALRKTTPDHTFTAANGITLSPDEKTLYVSAWGDGIDAIDMSSRSATPVAHPAAVCLAYIDGLYAIKGSLIAIQNGPMAPRIVQFRLSLDGRKILGMTVIERRNPLFNGITTGALIKGELYYVANPQIDRKGADNVDALRILAALVLK